MQPHQPDPVKPTNRFLALAVSAVSAFALAAACPLAAAEECEGPAGAPTAKGACCPANPAEATETRAEHTGKAACPADQLTQTWGIEIASLRFSAQGSFIDFRYKVIDPDKAAPLVKQESKPYLIDQATGKKLQVPTTPKLGPLRQTAQKLIAGRIYYIFFGNSRGIVRPGGKVTVVIGDCRIENLTVE